MSFQSKTQEVRSLSDWVKKLGGGRVWRTRGGGKLAKHGVGEEAQSAHSQVTRVFELLLMRLETEDEKVFKNILIKFGYRWIV